MGSTSPTRLVTPEHLGGSFGVLLAEAYSLEPTCRRLVLSNDESDVCRGRTAYQARLGELLEPSADNSTLGRVFVALHLKHGNVLAAGPQNLIAHLPWMEVAHP